MMSSGKRSARRADAIFLVQVIAGMASFFGVLALIVSFVGAQFDPIRASVIIAIAAGSLVFWNLFWAVPSFIHAVVTDGESVKGGRYLVALVVFSIIGAVDTFVAVTLTPMVENILRAPGWGATVATLGIMVVALTVIIWFVAVVNDEA